MDYSGCMHVYGLYKHDENHMLKKHQVYWTVGYVLVLVLILHVIKVGIDEATIKMRKILQYGNIVMVVATL